MSETGPKDNEAKFAARFTPAYTRIFLWGLGVLVFAISIYAFYAGIGADTPFPTLLSALTGVVIAIVVWAVVAVVVTLAWLGLQTLVKR